MSSALSQASRSVAIVLSPFQVGERVILQFLLKRQTVELSAKRELAINFILADIEVDDVKESCLRSACHAMNSLTTARKTDQRDE